MLVFLNLVIFAFKLLYLLPNGKGVDWAVISP